MLYWNNLPEAYILLGFYEFYIVLYYKIWSIFFTTCEDLVKSFWFKPPTLQQQKYLSTMPAEILTTDDLREFKQEILAEIKLLLSDISALKPADKKYLKSLELQEILDMSPASLQNLRNARVLPYTKIGGTFYYEWDDIVQLMDKFKKPAKAKI